MIDHPLVPPPPFASQWISGVPVGSVCPYAGRVAVSSADAGGANGAQPAIWLEQWGWLFCDGRELPIVAYPMLFTAIGTLYGGDGQTVFRLPDYRGLFLRCTDSGAGVDPGAAQRKSPATGDTDSGVGSLQADALQDHQHAYGFAAVGGSSSQQFQAGKAKLPASPTASGNPIQPGSLTPANPQGDAARTGSETRPRNIYVNYIIKCQ